ncbi:MAG: serine protease [Firmicutes bacterium]|nr:serine protease [Bacillota bacterium]
MKKKSISFVVTVCLLMALLVTPAFAFGAENSSCSSASLQKASCQQTQYQKKYGTKVRMIRKACQDPRVWSCWAKKNPCSMITPGTGSNVQSPAEGNGSQLSDSLSTAEKQVAQLVNEERAAEGLAPLELNGELSAVAQAKARDMAEKGYFSHTSPTYGTPSEMVKSFGLTYRAVGENIAKGYLTADSVMTGWMRSSGHRANILSDAYSEIGVGCAEDSNGTLYWVQLFRR